jgi:hypothetical protein
MYKFKVKCRFCDKFLPLNGFGRHLKGKNCNGTMKSYIRLESIMEDNDDYSWGTLHLVEIEKPTVVDYRKREDSEDSESD